MLVEVHEGEKYPYTFVATLEDQLADFDHWDEGSDKKRALAAEREHFERVAISIPGELANDLFTLRKREEELLRQVKAYELVAAAKKVEEDR